MKRNTQDMAGHPIAEGRKALVADDDRVMRSLLKYKLKKAGFGVISASDGQQALDRMSDQIGVVLLDLQMPEIDGITCLRRIREKFHDVSPIMITASEDVSDAVEAMKYGAFDYLVKPVNPRQFIALVEKALDNWCQARRLRQVEAELAHAREREIEIASKIQKTLLMGKPPQHMQGIRIAQLTIPSEKVDGDFFDFFRLRDHALDIVVGDVMGKGIASALLGAAIKSHFLRVINNLVLRNQCQSPPEPQQIVSFLHTGMIEQMEDIETFVTLCYARIDLIQSRISFVDCGHMRTVHYHNRSGGVSLLEGVNVPLGFPETGLFHQISVPFVPGDFFFFYSDGLTEAQNPEGELYGEERLVRFIRKNGQTDPDDLIYKIRRDISNFSESESFDDDFTCVVAAIEKTP